MRVLVIGATGSVGRGIVDGLLSAGVAVRALTRRPENAGLPAGVEVVGGDLADLDGVESLVGGVDRMYLMHSGHPVAALLARAAEAGVRRVVTLSSASAAWPDDPSGVRHRATEVAVEESGTEWAHVRPGMFMSNLTWWAESIRAGGVVREPWADAAQTPVHEADVAAVATAALLHDGLTGTVLTLSGPEVLTKREQLAAIGDALGRELRFEELDPARWRASGFLPTAAADMLLRYWAESARTPDAVLATVSEVTGRPARTLRDWAREHVADFG